MPSLKIEHIFRKTWTETEPNEHTTKTSLLWRGVLRVSVGSRRCNIGWGLGVLKATQNNAQLVAVPLLIMSIILDSSSSSSLASQELEETSPALQLSPHSVDSFNRTICFVSRRKVLPIFSDSKAKRNSRFLSLLSERNERIQRESRRANHR